MMLYRWKDKNQRGSAPPRNPKAEPACEKRTCRFGAAECTSKAQLLARCLSRSMYAVGLMVSVAARKL